MELKWDSQHIETDFVSFLCHFFAPLFFTTLLSLAHPLGRTLSCTWQLQRWSPWGCWGWGWRACRTRPSSGRWLRATAGRCWSRCACAYWPSAPQWWADCQLHSRRRWVSRAEYAVCGPRLLEEKQRTKIVLHDPQNVEMMHSNQMQ